MEAFESQTPRFYTPTALVDALVDRLIEDPRSWFVPDPGGNPPVGVVNGQHRISGIFLSPDEAAAVCIAADLFRSRLRVAALGMRTATTTEGRREAARDFLSALADLLACLIGFVVRLLLRLLSRLLGRVTANDLPVQTSVPLEHTPQIAPRGPNPAFLVNTNRGGHHRSTLGSVVLTA